MFINKFGNILFEAIRPLHLSVAMCLKSCIIPSDTNQLYYYRSKLSMKTEVNEIKEITKKIKNFRDERDWMQFHNHKDMALALLLEAAEVLEHFQWKSNKEIGKYTQSSKNEIADEIADVAICLFELADNMKIDLLSAVTTKLEKNAKKYPVTKAKGSNLKYNKL